MSFLQMEGRRVLVMGLANKKSVAYHIADGLKQAGAEVVYSVRSEARREQVIKLTGDSEVIVCDVERPKELAHLALQIRASEKPLHGLVHSIAFANYSEGFKPLHQTKREDFLQAMQISAFSLCEIALAMKELFSKDASVVSIGISDTKLTTENYGYMSPIKAALDAISSGLAKSFSADSEVRFNTVKAGPLKTSASAGIPGYMENYLYAEQMTYRKQALHTEEVANAALFFLSPRSSGINGTGLVVDAGLGNNYFDQQIVKNAMRPEVN